MDRVRTRMPPLDQAAALLQEVSGAEEMSEHTVLLDVDVDSIDFIEWVVALGFDDEEIPLDDEDLYDILEDGTFGDLYRAVRQAAAT